MGRRVANSAYAPKIEAIRRKENPSYLFLSYHPEESKIERLFLVPRHFFTPQIIEKRPPLKKGARREGWEGSNIRLGKLPSDALIPMVEDGKVVPRGKVRGMWERFSFLEEESLESRGWLADVHSKVRELDREAFTLADIYGYEGDLARMHPRNMHVRAKIRQQLQVLRDHGVNPYIWSRGSLKSMFGKLAGKHGSIGVLGIACVVELIHGMRFCMKAKLPVMGIPLNANRCSRWMDGFFETSVDLLALENILN